MRKLMIGIGLFVLAGSFVIAPPKRYPEKLSDWGLFAGKLADLKPNNGVVPYALNTPLYTDYAEKLRFLKLPAGASVAYHASSVLDFPVGSLLIKNFYYSANHFA